MVFSSHIFLFWFLPLALLLYYAVPVRARSLVLTLVSYIFYGWWNPWFTLLMLFSTAIDYFCGAAIAREGATPRQRKVALVASVFSNLALLGFFKYALFVSETFGKVATIFGFGEVPLPAFLSHIVLPVGISFYTFQSMSYAIDLYRGHAVRARNFTDFACYVSMFPQLVAGPIVRYGTVAEQLRERTHSLEGFVAGLTRFNYGFAKKILLANPMGRLADLAFEAGSPGAPVAWAGILAYALQIYFDFSAYSDMAVGLGRMMGFRFPENFNSPYQSTSLTEFWRRWHISLSTFLRDYLYIPLGGNRMGSARTYLNLLLVMLIGGLWHGAQWTFVIWGGLHGLVLALERFGKNVLKISLPRPVGWTATTLVVLAGWVFFRSPDLATALDYFSALAGREGEVASSTVLAAVFFTPVNLAQLAGCTAVAWFLPNSGRWLHIVTGAKVALGIALLFVSVRVMALQGFNPFLYFQF